MTTASARAEIVEKLKDLLRQQPDVKFDADAVTEETRIDEVGFDSLSILDFMYEIENVFGVPMEVRDVVDMQRVSDLIDHLARKRAV